MLKPHIRPIYGCPPGNVYVTPGLLITCHPTQLRLAFKAAIELWTEQRIGH